MRRSLLLSVLLLMSILFSVPLSADPSLFPNEATTTTTTPTTLCYYKGPDTWDEHLELTEFKVTGNSPVRPKDTVTIDFTIRNVGTVTVRLLGDGIFAKAKDPSGTVRSYKNTQQNPALLNNGESVHYHGQAELDQVGQWSIWPTFDVLVLAAGRTEEYGPDLWHACFISVCGTGCECLTPGEAQKLGYVPCPPEKIVCGKDEHNEDKYCYRKAPVTTTTTVGPTPVASCSDGIKNQNEDGVDCGGVCPPCNRCNLSTLPSRFDWRDYAVLPPVRAQGACGSCWAFSALGAVEGTYSVEHSAATPIIDLSEQFLVSDCGGKGSCKGGHNHQALEFVKSTGVVDETCFPYQSGGCMWRDGGKWHCCGTSEVMSGTCPYSCSCGGFCANPCTCNTCAGSANKLWSVGQMKQVRRVEEIKRALICHGPLSAASKNWRHGVVIVGYDDAKGNWTIRNSWGTVWAGTNYAPGYGGIPYEGHRYSDIKNEVYYVQAVSRGFSLSIQGNDGLAAGDVNADGKAEIIHGDRSEDMIRIFDMKGIELKHFPQDYEDHDGLAAGDVNADGKAEIIHGDQSDDKIRIFDMDGSKLGWFEQDFREWDALAAGDVNGDGKAEIIHGFRGGEFGIHIFDMNGNKLSEFRLAYEKHDGLAAGDVNGDGKAEVVLADQDGWIRIYDMNGNEVRVDRMDYEKHDGFTVGDVNGDGVAEMIHGDQSEDMIRIFDMDGNRVKEFAVDFREWDRLAAADLNADLNRKAEIIHLHTGDWIRVYDVYGLYENF